MITPMVARLVRDPFDHQGWLFRASERHFGAGRMSFDSLAKMAHLANDLCSASSQSQGSSLRASGASAASAFQSLPVMSAYPSKR
jgi:hypothetical protein